MPVQLTDREGGDVDLKSTTDGGEEVIHHRIDGTVTVGGTVTVNAGSNNIGDVDVLTLPALPAGTNAIGTVGLTKGTRTNSTAAPTTTAGSALAANASRKVALLYNNGTQIVYLGTSSGVTTSNGYPLPPGAELADDASTGAWWAITASGTGDLRIVEVA